MAWFSNLWSFRTKITVLSTKVAGNLTDMPVYVDLSLLPSEFWTNVRSDGGDMRVTSGDGITELPREIVEIDTGAQTGELHFKSDSLSATANTDFYIYYGNANAEDHPVDGTYGRNNVWTDYSYVHHMNESSGNIIDSTGNGFDGVPQGSITYDDTGKLGNSIEIDPITITRLVWVPARR